MGNQKLYKGSLQTIILKLLAQNDKMYGYEITQRVKELSTGRILLTEGALYPTLHKLETERILQTTSVVVNKRVRKYYSLTREGHSLVSERVNEFVDFIKTMANVLNVKLV